MLKGQRDPDGHFEGGQPGHPAEMLPETHFPVTCDDIGRKPLSEWQLMWKPGLRRFVSAHTTTPLGRK
jgi:hypothetical protein